MSAAQITEANAEHAASEWLGDLGYHILTESPPPSRL
jgi:hypothetical protein